MWKRIAEARDPEKEALRLRARLAKVSRRLDRVSRGRRAWQFLKVLAGCFVVGAAVTFTLIEIAESRWPIGTAIRHRLAGQNCGFAQSVGLAPARRGGPGYHDHLDADGDGIACEPLPRR